MHERAAEQVAEVVVVGADGEGLLRRALERRGVSVEAAALDRLGEARPARAVLVDWAAIEGVAEARERLGEEATIVAVLAADAVGARLEALRHGARLVDRVDDVEALADAVLDDERRTPLGWGSLSGLLTVVGERVRGQLGAAAGGVALRIEDGEAAVALIDRFAGELVALSTETRADGSGPSVEDLGWDDDPETMEQPEAELERWRRIAARGAVPAQEAAVLGALEKATQVAGDRRGPWAASDSQPPPSADHLPLADAAEDEEDDGVSEGDRPTPVGPPPSWLLDGDDGAASP